MTNTNNGWPGKPGVPLNPGLPGAHWLKGCTEDAWMYDGDNGWWGPGYSHKLDAETVAAGYAYLGPCLTPDQAMALAARVAELEKALKINFHKHVQGASAADVVITRILPYSVSGVELKRLTEGKKDE